MNGHPGKAVHDVYLDFVYAHFRIPADAPPSVTVPCRQADVRGRKVWPGQLRNGFDDDEG